ncbi:ABC transporter permease [Streptomyces synnematoformans]|uniref:ABC transporter permease n=1 Tax=Streptomyces synnematoformans TaxID=415721 RepID=A0ABN2YTJ7_9ACTN
MNFVKRAGMSLSARKSRTAVLLGIFVVICTLLLGGFLLRSAAERQEAAAQRDIGVDVTVRKKGMSAADADRLGVLDVVHRYNPRLPVRAGADGFAALTSRQPAPGGARGGGKGPLAVVGVRDAGLLPPFSYGSTEITSGRGIAPADAGRRVAMIEERLAAENDLGVGDTIRVRSADGGRTVPVGIVGIFADPTQDPTGGAPPHRLPGNVLYVPVHTAQQLGKPGNAGKGSGSGDAAVTAAEAAYRVGSPDQAERLHAAADRLLGAGSFDFRVNDKAYRDQVRPIQRVGAFASLIVLVIAVAGALILGLLVTLQIRERRDELGVLLSMGERKWKLIGQHAVEVAALALPAVAVAAVAGQLAGSAAGTALLDGGSQHRRAAAADGVDATVPPPDLHVEPAAVARVAGIGLGISLISTVVPGIGILRLHPRSILAGTE